ncbi:MAG TPA: HDOD domain-containing protein [Polyangiaceae bacterium]
MSQPAHTLEAMDGLAALLDRVTEVSPLPATAQRILELTQSDEISIPNLSRVIATDPALASAVLRIANSAAYGGRNIDKLDVALMRIGTRELRDMAAAMCVLAAFRSPGELSLRLHDRSVVSGAICSRIAKESGTASTGTAFTCGLLAEIGAMACVAVDGKAYVQLWQQALGSEQRRLELERERYGTFTSLDVGYHFLSRNAVPAAVCEAVGTPLDATIAEKPALSKATVLARHATARLINKATTAPQTQVRTELTELAEAVALPGVDGGRLLELCIEAGAKAQEALKQTR